MRFLRSIQQDAKLFIYIYILLMLFRCAFLIIYSGQLGNAGAGDIAEALWLGARISLKTTAFLVAFPCGLSFYFCDNSLQFLVAMASPEDTECLRECGYCHYDGAFYGPDSLL